MTDGNFTGRCENSNDAKISQITLKFGSLNPDIIITHPPFRSNIKRKALATSTFFSKMEGVLMFILILYSLMGVAVLIFCCYTCFKAPEPSKEERIVPVQSTDDNPQALQDANANQEIVVAEDAPEDTATSVHESIPLEDLSTTSTGEGMSSNASVETPLPLYQSDILPQYSEVGFDG